MMTAVMMKADTKPARRGSNVGESWTIVGSPSTLSWEGWSAWGLVWAEVLGGLMVEFRWTLLEVLGYPPVSFCGDESVDDSEWGGF